MQKSGEHRAGFIRTREIEEWTNAALIHPLSERFTRIFARLRLHPNVVSIFGMLLGVGAGLAYHHAGSAGDVALGFALMIGWHVMDGADGQLARLTGKTSEIGKVLDGLADHVAFAAVYVALAGYLSFGYGAEAWLIVVGAGLSHVIQSAAYEYRRQTYDYVVHGKASARVPGLDEWRRTLANRHGIRGIFAAVYLVYIHIQHIASGADVAVSVALEKAMRAAGHPQEVAAIYRDANLTAVKKWSVLSSNYRTLAIFAFCLLGKPLYYFIYEIVVLNAALLLLTRMQRRRNTVLQEELASLVHEEAA